MAFDTLIIYIYFNHLKKTSANMSTPMFTRKASPKYPEMNSYLYCRKDLTVPQHTHPTMPL